MLVYILAAIIFTEYVPVHCELIINPTIATNFTDNVTSEVGILKKELIDDVGSASDSGSAEKETVLEIIYKRPFNLRKLIQEMFDRDHGTCTESGEVKTRYLMDILRQVLNQHEIRSLIEVTFEPAEAVLARIVHDTIDGTFNGGDAVEEIICGQDNVMKGLIQEYYVRVYQQPLETHFLKYKTDDVDYQQVMMQFCWPNRLPDLQQPKEVLTLEVQALQQIDPSADKEGFKNKLKEILPKYSEADLQQIFINYRDADGKGIDDAVDKVIENKDEKRAYNYYVRYVESTCKFYADLLYDAVEGGIMKTNVPAINRIVITRCERDLGCILEKYKETHNKSFKDRLNKDIWTDDDYLSAMGHLCGE